MGESDSKQAPIIVNPGAVQVAGDTARDTIGALGAQPVLLLIVILNMIFIGAGAYFFVQLEHFRHAERSQIITLLARCEAPDRPVQRRE
jgi:hypothetical protein